MNLNKNQLNTFEYKNINNNSLKGNVYFLPPKIKPLGIIFWIHGGALIFGDKERIPVDLLKFSMDEHFIVISLEQRYIPYCYINDIVSDILDGISWFTKLQYLDIDFSKLPYSILGESSGAYLSLFAGLQKKDNLKAIGVYSGFNNINLDWCNTPNKYYKNNTTNISLHLNSSFFEKLNYFYYLKCIGLWAEIACGKSIKSIPSYYKLYSPIFKINKYFPPTVIIHGEQDFDVPFSEAQNLFAKLNELNIENLLIKIQKEGHLFFDTNDIEIEKSIQDSFKFITKQMKK